MKAMPMPAHEIEAINLFAEEQKMRRLFEAVIEGTATAEEKAALVEWIER